MANIKDLKPCPFGCPKTTRSPVFYDDRMVRCEKCQTNSGNTYSILTSHGQNAARRDYDVCKNLAFELWNARTPAAMTAIMERVKTDPMSFSTKAAPAPPENTMGWAEAQLTHGEFVQGVEYKMRELPRASGEPLLALAVDHDGTQHTVPGNVFRLVAL